MSSDAALSAPLPPPSPRPFAQAWASMRAVVFALALRELKTRLDGRRRGLLWILGEPLASTAVLLAMYGLVRAHAVAGLDTLLFLVSGVLPFQFFKQLVLRTMESIDANQGLFAYRQVRPIDTVVARALVEVALAVAVATVVIALLAWLGHPLWPRHPLELLGVSALVVALGTALGLLVAVSTGGGAGRVRAALRVAMMPMMVLSGVVFPIAVLPQPVREWLALNPLLHLLEMLRVAVFGDAYRAMPETSPTLPIGVVLIAATLALAIYRTRRERLRTS